MRPCALKWQPSKGRCGLLLLLLLLLFLPCCSPCNPKRWFLIAQSIMQTSPMLVCPPALRHLQVQQLQGQVADMEWQLQLCRVPGNMQRASINVSHPQQTTGGISQLPPAPSLSISLPHASSLMLPPMVGPLFTSVQQGEAGVMQQEGLGLEGFDFAFSSRRGSSFA